MATKATEAPTGDRPYSSRWGRFRISGHYFAAVRGADLESDYAKSLMALFGQMIIIRANDCPWGAGIDYTAVSPMFDELVEGEAIPWYELEWQAVDHGEDFVQDGHAHRCETISKAVKRKPPAEQW